MSLSFQARIIRNDAVVSTEFDGDTVMIDPSFENYFGMEEVGTYIWDSLAKACVIEVLLRNLTEEFDVSMDQCAKDVMPFLEKMIEKDLIELENDA